MIEENKVVANKTNWLGRIIFFTVVIMFVYFINKDANEYSEYRKTFKGEAIGFATKIKRSNKNSYLKYYFYSGKRFLGKTSSSNKELVNKFYKVKYDLNNPSANYIILDKELKPDSITLVKAGFAKVKYYIYDGGVTCKYIEKSKWK
ncbi:hypothetical protein [Flavobacterium eburneipallidum]|uniref:hypothetical protein n=1 Tax=Flavobacterium eburneipallidum TaxID=3003263 RepID=UPI0024821F11|nr:hypothetical protein [Flavobacterium eburneipallidum]